MAAAEIYSEGRGIFDAMPYIKAMEAQKKAKDVAVKNYFKDLNTKINTAGVRSQDILDPKTGQGIQADINNWTDFYINNKDAITKGGAAKIQFETMHREILNRIEQSKGVGKKELEFGKAKFEGKYDPDDDDIKVLDRMGASIYNPYHYKENAINPAYVDNKGTEFGWEDISMSIPGLTTDEKKKVFNYSRGGAKLEIDEKSGRILDKDTRVYDKRYSDKSLATGASNMYMLIKETPVSIEEKKLKKYYNKLKEDPYFLAQANPLYEKFFNKPIQTAADAAAADYLLTDSRVQEQEKSPIKKEKSGGGRGGASDAIGYDYWKDLRGMMAENITNYGSSNILVTNLPSSLSNIISKQLDISKKQKIKPSETFVGELNGKVGLFKTAISLKQGRKGEMLPSDEARIVWLDELEFNKLGNPSEKSQKVFKEKAISKQKSGGIKGTNEKLF